MFHIRFLPPPDQKCAESSMYWQFFYYCPPGKFWFTHLGEIVKMLCQELDTYIYIYMTLLIIDMDFQPGIDCTTFHSFFSWKVWKKKMFFKILKSWQVCDWLAKWIIMLRFMNRRSCCFLSWLVTYSVPSLYLDDCWFIVSCMLNNTQQWNFNQNKRLPR